MYAKMLGIRLTVLKARYALDVCAAEKAIHDMAVLLLESDVARGLRAFNTVVMNAWNGRLPIVQHRMTLLS